MHATVSHYHAWHCATALHRVAHRGCDTLTRWWCWHLQGREGEGWRNAMSSTWGGASLAVECSHHEHSNSLVTWHTRHLLPAPQASPTVVTLTKGDTLAVATALCRAPHLLHARLLPATRRGWVHCDTLCVLAAAACPTIAPPRRLHRPNAGSPSQDLLTRAAQLPACPCLPSLTSALCQCSATCLSLDSPASSTRSPVLASNVE